jgi:hypothetical protein
MPDNLFLIRQLANRAKSFHKLTGVTHRSFLMLGGVQVAVEETLEQ